MTVVEEGLLLSTEDTSTKGIAPYLYEKETEYFGFFPIVFIDRLLNHVTELTYNTIDKFASILYQSDEVQNISTEQLNEGLEKMLGLFEFYSQLNFTYFEGFVLKNIFRFPSKIFTLMNDEGGMREPGFLNNSKNEEEVQTAISEIEGEWSAKHKALKHAKLLNCHLKFELLKYDKLSRIYMKLQEQFHSLSEQYRLAIGGGDGYVESVEKHKKSMERLKSITQETMERSKVLLRLNQMDHHQGKDSKWSRFIEAAEDDEGEIWHLVEEHDINTLLDCL